MDNQFIFQVSKTLTFLFILELKSYSESAACSQPFGLQFNNLSNVESITHTVENKWNTSKIETVNWDQEGAQGGDTKVS